MKQVSKVIKNGVTYYFADSALTQSVDNIVDTLNNLSIPDSTSDLINDSGFLDSSDFKTINNQSIVGSGNIDIQGGGGGSYSAGTNIDITNDVISVTGITVPTAMSQLSNDSGYLTKTSADTIYATQADLDNVSDSLDDYLTESAASQTYQLKTQFRTINGSGITGDNTNIVISVPTSTSELINDSNYVASTNLKTINNSSLVGSGNIVVPTFTYDSTTQTLNITT